MKMNRKIGSIIMLRVSAAMEVGFVTNTNQSAEFIRTLNRNATTGIDAVYFNPAGLTKLGDGTHIALSNQSIFQTKTVDNTILNKTYEGSVQASFFPNLYVAPIRPASWPSRRDSCPSGVGAVPSTTLGYHRLSCR